VDGLVQYGGGSPVQRQSPMPVLTAVAGTELTTVESQIQRHNHQTSESPSQTIEPPSLVAEEERTRSGHWLGSVLRVSKSVG